jgi:hypothetical protein
MTSAMVIALKNQPRMLEHKVSRRKKPRGTAL